MRSWQLWLIVFYIALGSFASESFMIGTAVVALSCAMIFGAMGR